MSKEELTTEGRIEELEKAITQIASMLSDKDKEEESSDSEGHRERTRDEHLSMLKDMNITENEYYEEAWNSVQKQRSLAVLLAESFQTIKSFSRDIGYRNFNDLRDVEEARETFEIWNKISRRKRRMNIAQRLMR